MPERVRLERLPQAPAQARGHVVDSLSGRVEAAIVEDVKLLVSELVTNAVRHQREHGSIEMTIRLGKDGVRVEVSDPGMGFDKPKIGEPPPDALGGRGLLIVERVASRWGVTPGRPTRVWFELDA